MESAFGLVVPGRPLVTEFVQTEETKFVVEIPNPGEITEVSFFLNLFKGIPNCGYILYYSVIPFTEWSILGAVTLAVFHTGWPNDTGVSKYPLLRLCVSLESVETTLNLAPTLKPQQLENSLVKIATDSFNYISSFIEDSAVGPIVRNPSLLFSQWLERIKKKILDDPSAFQI